MIIGIIDDFVDFGVGLGRRLSDKHDIIVGTSEDRYVAAATSSTIRSYIQDAENNIRFTSFRETFKEADIIILLYPLDFAVQIARVDPKDIEGKIIISTGSPSVSTVKGGYALKIKKMLPESAKIVTALANIACYKWQTFDEVPDYTVPVCGDDAEAKKTVIKLINEIPGFYGLDAGPLAISELIENLEPLAINIEQINCMRDLTINIK